MNHILQNVKSGFANMKELFGIFISVDENSDGYDLYINSKDTELSQPKRSTKSTKKNYKSNPSATSKSSHKKISNDEHIREGIEPEI